MGFQASHLNSRWHKHTHMIAHIGSLIAKGASKLSIVAPTERRRKEFRQSPIRLYPQNGPNTQSGQPCLRIPAELQETGLRSPRASLLVVCSPLPEKNMRVPCSMRTSAQLETGRTMGESPICRSCFQIVAVVLPRCTSSTRFQKRGKIS